MTKTLADKAEARRAQRIVRRAQGLCIQCNAPSPTRVRCLICAGAAAKRVQVWSKKRYQELKVAAFAAYGNKCSCCDFDDQRFLTIDHVFNDGAAHRNEVGHSTTSLLRWLQLNNYPTDRFQLLCWNCNMAKARHGGVCPHQIDAPMVLAA